MNTNAKSRIQVQVQVQVKQPIIFFDGACGMCNGFVDRVLRLDRERAFVFAPLQGSTAREMLGPLPGNAREWSLAYVDEAGAHDQSDAVLEICARLGGAWRLLSWLRLAPRSIRNSAYRVVARNRFRCGKRDSCRLLTLAEQARFLP